MDVFQLTLRLLTGMDRKFDSIDTTWHNGSPSLGCNAQEGSDERSEE